MTFDNDLGEFEKKVLKNVILVIFHETNGYFSSKSCSIK